MSDSYRDAGVDIDAQDEALAGIKEMVAGTANAAVLSGVGNFGGLYQLPEGLEQPVLVASADGVGTKLMVARMARDYSTVGRDLVNHCVNDILVQGARPLFFLDYVGCGVLESEQMVDLVRGVVAGCEENSCVLLGGETAEMPGFYQPGDYELVGFVVGLVERAALIEGRAIEPGDVLIGLPSAGLHTNGFSLARRILFEQCGLALDDEIPGIEPAGRTVRDELLAPHLSYLPVLGGLLRHPALLALAHITGGGLTDNLPRVLPPGVRALIDRHSWQPLGVFESLARLGQVDDAEMLRVFNMGVGMVVIARGGQEAEVLAELEASNAQPVVIGRVEGHPEGTLATTEQVVYA